jgi:hypothetical protein
MQNKNGSGSLVVYRPSHLRTRGSKAIRKVSQKKVVLFRRISDPNYLVDLAKICGLRYANGVIEAMEEGVQTDGSHVLQESRELMDFWSDESDEADEGGETNDDDATDSEEHGNMGTWERGGRLQGMVGTRGAGRKHEGPPNGLSGETGTCLVLSHCAPCLCVSASYQIHPGVC